jgi:hypothetical protein
MMVHRDVWMNSKFFWDHYFKTAGHDGVGYTLGDGRTVGIHDGLPDGLHQRAPVKATR